MTEQRVCRVFAHSAALLCLCAGWRGARHLTAWLADIAANPAGSRGNGEWFALCCRGHAMASPSALQLTAMLCMMRWIARISNHAWSYGVFVCVYVQNRVLVSHKSGILSQNLRGAYALRLTQSQAQCLFSQTNMRLLATGMIVRILARVYRRSVQASLQSHGVHVG